MYVISLTYLVDIDVMDEARPRHLEWLQKHYDADLFLASGRKTPAKGGVILARAMPREKLDQILATDPFALENLATYDIIEFDPAMTCSALAGVA
jgi:uncharacterized protein YciI